MEHTTSNSGHSGTGGHHGHKPEAGRQFFSWIRSTGLTRPDDGWAGGLFAALSARIGWDAALVRGLGVVVFILFFSPAALLYGLGWILVPNTRGEIHAQEAVRGNYTSGLFGGGVLAVIGGLNVFTPVSLAGPFAVLLNLAIIAAVVWVVWSSVKKHRQNRTSADRDSSPPSPGADDGGTGDSGADGRADGGAGAGEASGKDRAGNSSSRRTDGKPAWYPKDTAPADAGATSSESTYPPGPGHNGAAAGGPGQPAAGHAGTPTAPEPAGVVRTQEAQEEQDEGGGRRGLMTLGLLLLAAPVLLGTVWVASQFGVALTTALLLGLAGIVVLLAVRHIIGAARGKKGRGGMLAVATVLMMVLFAGHSGAGPDAGSAANHVFGDYATAEESVNSAFADTTVDLRHLTPQTTQEASEEAEQAASATVHNAQINSAFANTTVIVPDDTEVQVDNSLLLGSLDAHMQEGGASSAGLSGSDTTAGPADAPNAIELDLNAAFSNVDIYDASTYDAEGEEDDVEQEDAQR